MTAVWPPLPAVLVGVCLVSACGRPAAEVTGAPARTLPPRPATEEQAAPRGRLLLEAFRGRLAACRGFEAEMTSRGEGTWDDGVDTGVRRTNRNRALLRWTKPNRLHGEMREAPFALMVGGTLDTTDGVNLTLRPSGLLSVVALRILATDVKLRNSRNHTFRDSHPAAQLARLTSPPAAWLVRSEGPEAATVEVTGVRRLDGGVDRELVALAPSDLALRSITMMAADRPVVAQTFKGFRWR